MASWNLKELREKTGQALREIERRELSDFLDSFDWKSKATYYHLLQADECFKPYIEIEDIKITHQLLSRSEDFELAIKIREISLVSSVMTANTLPEVLAQVINIVLSNKNFKINDVTPNKILAQMNNGELKKNYQALIESDEYAYIKSFTNIVKHINLVKSDYHISFVDGVHGVRFKAFEYKDRAFPEMLDRDLISTVKTFRSMCLKLGIGINEEVC